MTSSKILRELQKLNDTCRTYITIRKETLEAAVRHMEVLELTVEKLKMEMWDYVSPNAIGDRHEMGG